MNKLKRIFAFIVAFVAVLGLAACSKSFGGTIELIETRDTIQVKASFDEHPDLTSGKAKPYAKLFKMDGDKEEYKTDENIKMNGRFTAGEALFDNLEPETTYKVYLFVSLDGKDYEVASDKKKTLNSGNTAENPFLIKTVDDFLAMERDPDGYYELANDIDFEGETMDDMFTSSNKFEGTFDGKNHSISNFKVKSASNAGVFGYTKGATIKNVVINDAKIDLGSGRSTTNMGILIGRADDTVVENVIVNSPKVVLAGNSTSDINLGIIAGYINNGSFFNNTVNNADIEITKSRLNMSAGIFAGAIKGKSNSGKFIENNIVTGKLYANAYYPNSKGSSYIGGFVGSVGAQGLIKDCGVVADIRITKQHDDSYADEYQLAVGGFVGFNRIGSINIEKCVAVADIKGYAGTIKDDSTVVDYSKNKMSKNPVYFGGFAGRLETLFNKVADSAYIKLTSDITLSMLLEEEKKVEDEKKSTEDTNPEAPKEMIQLVYKGEAVGYTDAPEKLINIITPANDTNNYSGFTQAIQDMITKALNSK